MDADTDAPIAGAKVVVEWTSIAIDRKKHKINLERRSGSAPTNRLGEYRLCGVPADQSLAVQVQHKDVDVFQEAVVQPAVDVSKLDTVGHSA